ncbi:MAG: hypothetical protein QW667_05910 [Candidatus Bathyarchaeia archaeon]
MNKLNVACVSIIIIGIILFIYGSNYYNAFAGWTGVFLALGGIVAGLILRVYESFGGK